MRENIYIAFLFLSILGFSQSSIHEVLKKYNTQKIPYITIDSLSKQNGFTLLDAREFKEFNVSHLKHSIHAGYENFKLHTITSKIKDKKTPIVVYCSLGVRSENIAEKLKNAGYINVYNLYGGIFEWKNHGFPVYDSSGVETEKVHVYSKYWSQYLTKGEKVDE